MADNVGVAADGGLDQAGIWVLRATVALTCIGFAYSSYVQSRSLWLAAIVVLAAVSVLARPYPLVLVGLAAFMFSEAVDAAARSAGPGWPVLTLFAQAGRYMAPVALMLVSLPAPNRSRLEVLEWLLRVCAAAIFLGHGVRAILGSPVFLNLLELGIGLRGSPAVAVLISIGLVDVFVAGVILLTRSRVAVAYMAVWGAITAFGRVAAFGMGVGWFMVLERTANFAVPLTLLIWWTSTVRFSSTSRLSIDASLVGGGR